MGLNQPTDMSYLGEATVWGDGDVLAVTPVLDTSVYADGRVLFVPIEIPNAVRTPGGNLWAHSLFVLDEDDQGVAFDLVFMDSNASLGTLNQAVSVSDANARAIVGRVSVSSGDFYDASGRRRPIQAGSLPGRSTVIRPEAPRRRARRPAASWPGRSGRRRSAG